MATTPEMLSVSPWATPDNKSSDTILKGFRTTLEQRWQEFDEATMKEAHNHPLAWLASEDTLTAKRNENADFKKAKATFDEARTTLGSLENDAALKNAIKWSGKLSITIQTLTTYLDKADKAKEHNTVLSQTLADLTSLKAQMTENTEDQRVAEVAKVAVATSAAAVAESALLVPDFSNAMGDGAREIMSEAGKEVASIKKNPLKKIAEFFGFSNESIISDMKEALSEKKSGGFEGVLAGIKIWFYGFLAKIMGTDIAKSLTPEEMKLAGMKPRIEKKGGERRRNDNAERLKEAGNTALIRTSYKWFARIFIQPVIDTSGKKKIFSYEDIDQLITINTFKDMPFQKLIELHTRYQNVSNKKGILADVGISDPNIDPELIVFVIERITTWKWGAYIDKHALPWTDASFTVGWVFSRLHKHMHLGEKFSTLKPSKPITGPSDIGEFMGEIGTKLDMPLDNPSSLLSNIDYEWSFKDLSIGASMLGYIGTIRKLNINQIDQKTITEADIDSEWKKSMQKVLDFWKTFQNTIADKFSFGQSAEYKNFLQEKWANLGDVFRLYVVTGWNPSYEGMNAAQQAYIYMKLWNILGTDGNFRGTYFNKPLISAFFDDATQFTIPPDVKNIIGTLFNSAIETSLDKIGWFIGEVWATLNTKQKTIFIATAWAGIALLWYLKPLKWIWMGITSTILAWSVWVAVVAVWPNQEKIKLGTTEYSPDQVKNGIVAHVDNLVK